VEVLPAQHDVSVPSQQSMQMVSGGVDEFGGGAVGDEQKVVRWVGF